MSHAFLNMLTIRRLGRTHLPPRSTTATLGALAVVVMCVSSAQASVLTFEVFDNAPFFLNGNYNDSGVQPHLSTDYGYPEGFRVYPGYGENISSTQVGTPGTDSVIFQYGVGSEGFTPNVIARYGPFSIFTGGPELWREGYGDLDGVLYQGSRFGVPPIGTNYNMLDVVLIADAGWDVQLYGFDLGAFGGDLAINSVAVYGGVPFPFLAPNNDVFKEDNVVVAGTGSRTTFDFDALLGGPLTSQMIWIRIDANNLGDGSENIAIDNIRFGQLANLDNEDPIDLVVIDEALQTPDVVPEASSFLVWLLGGSGAALACLSRGRRRNE